MSTLTEEQEKLLNVVLGDIWSVNPETGLIDVYGDLIILNSDFLKDGKLTISFGTVHGDFLCKNLGMTTLESVPHTVNGTFNCMNNKLTSLKYAPNHVKFNMITWFNSLHSIEWNPSLLGGELRIDLSDIEDDYKGIIISEIEELIERGVKLNNPNKYYYPYRDAYYERKMIEIL